jgi:hypothetical protein
MPVDSISIVLYVPARPENLARLLAAMELKPGGIDVECIVIEDGPDAGMTENAPAAFPGNLTLLRNRLTIGRPISRNRGWRVAKGRWIVFLDANLIPEHGWLTAYRRAFDSGAPDVVVGTTYSGVRPMAYPGSDWAGSFRGSNFAIRRDLLVELQGFAPCLDVGDEIDFAIRLSELKPDVLVIPDARAQEIRGVTAYCREWTDAALRSLIYRNPVHAALSLIEGSQTGEIVPGELQSASGRPASLRSAVLAVPGSFASSQGELVRFFSRRAGVAEGIVSGYLEHAMSRGLIVRQHRGKTYCDFFHTANWLRAKTLYLENELTTAAFARTHPTPHQSGSSGAAPLTLSCRGRYHVTLDLAPGLCWDDTSINLCIPVPQRCQRNVVLKSFSPPGLAVHLDERNGLIANIPASVWIQCGGTVGYEFECDVCEEFWSDSPTRTTGDDRGLSRPRPEHLRFGYPSAYQQKAGALLEHILDGARSDPENDVRRVYRWIVENLSYAQTELPDESILDSGLGTCVHLARLFINLVRLRGIPGRECCGALMARRLSDSELVTFGLGHSLFSHTWAEVYLECRGWFAVDFVVMCYGKWQATSLNVSRDLRFALESESERLLDYYFGNVDPYRIYASKWANRIPALMAGKSGRERTRRDELMAHMYHRLGCEIRASGGVVAKP